MSNNNLASEMKQGMRRLASGVCVLSTRVNEKERFAMTVSSVTAVSDDPASLLVCINKNISLKGYLEQVGCTFAINALTVDQIDVSNVCAGVGPPCDRFLVGNWGEGADPYLTDAAAVFLCHTDEVLSYGTHNIIVAKIDSVQTPLKESLPLLYHDGSYGCFLKNSGK